MLRKSTQRERGRERSNKNPNMKMDMESGGRNGRNRCSQVEEESR